MEKQYKLSLKEIEESYDTQSILLEGVCIWPIIRFKINEEIRKNKGLKSRTFLLNRSIYKKLLTASFYGIWEIFKIKKYEYWIFSSSDRRKKIRNIYVDRVAEPLAVSLPNSLMIENPYPLGRHFKKKQLNDCNIISRTLFFAGTKVSGIFLKRNLPIKNEEVLVEILTENGISIDYIRVLNNYLAQYRFMKLLLSMTKPKAVFFVYAASSMGFIRAIKEKEIPVIEIQHGIINKSHYAYNVYKDFGKLLFPNYLMTYGQNELKIFNQNNYFIEQRNVFPVGYFFLDEFLKSPLRESYRNDLRNRFKKVIVFSLQDPFEEYTFDFLRRVSSLDPSLLYILVPRDIKKAYNNLNLGENVKIERSLNIYECLKMADFHASINSTCAIESLYFGVPNILFDYKNWASEYYNEILVDPKHTKYIKSPEEFITVIKDHEFHSKEIIVEKSKVLIKRNFWENVKEVLVKKILIKGNE